MTDKQYAVSLYSKYLDMLLQLYPNGINIKELKIIQDKAKECAITDVKNTIQLATDITDFKEFDVSNYANYYQGVLNELSLM
jgi:hypothetical protein